MDPGAVVRAGGAGLPPALPPAAQPHYLLRSEHPQVLLAFGLLTG